MNSIDQNKKYKNTEIMGSPYQIYTRMSSEQKKPVQVPVSRQRIAIKITNYLQLIK